MEKTPIISVIVPVYNAENYLDACVKSVLDQSFESFELVLIDDGSDDNSSVLCDTWAMDDDRIHVYHTANRGAAAARNAGLSKAVGDYVAFVDADDTVPSGYLSYLYKLMVEYKTDIAVCGYNLIFPGKNVSSDDTSHVDVNAMSGTQAMEKLLYQNGIMSVPWGNLSKRTLWSEVSFPEGRRVEDFATMYRLFSKAKRVVCSTKKLYNYFQRPGSTIYNKDTALAKNRDYFANSREMLVYVSKTYPESRSSAISRHFSTCFQIMSETGFSSAEKSLVGAVIRDVRRIQNAVMSDKRARLKNRVMAVASLVSVRLMHVVVYSVYKIKNGKLWV